MQDTNTQVSSVKVSTNSSVYIYNLHIIIENIRLFGGKNKKQGRIEVYNKNYGESGGEWGTVCSVGFGEKEANVACHQLGYKKATKIIKDSTTYINIGKPENKKIESGTQVLMFLNCHTGREEQLHHCQHNEHGDGDCDDANVNNDVGVICV